MSLSMKFSFARSAGSFEDSSSFRSFALASIAQDQHRLNRRGRGEKISAQVLRVAVSYWRDFISKDAAVVHFRSTATISEMVRS